MDKCPHCQGELRWPKKQCLWCEREAVVFCDYVFGQEKQNPGQYFSITDPIHTCDAPVCAMHAKRVGFICGGGELETIDRCPHHADSNPAMFVDMNEAAAKAARAEVGVIARRSKIRSV